MRIAAVGAISIATSFFSLPISGAHIEALALESAHYDHVVIHCLPGGTGFYAEPDGSHGPSEGAETDITLEYSFPDGPISVLDMVTTAVLKSGKVETITETLKDFEPVSFRLSKGDMSYEVPYILFEHGSHRNIIYKFDETGPILVSGFTAPFFSNLVYQRCYVRSRYEAGH